MRNPVIWHVWHRLHRSILAMHLYLPRFVDAVQQEVSLVSNVPSQSPHRAVRTLGRLQVYVALISLTQTTPSAYFTSLTCDVPTTWTQRHPSTHPLSIQRFDLRPWIDTPMLIPINVNRCDATLTIMDTQLYTSHYTFTVCTWITPASGNPCIGHITDTTYH